jgi:hypothetical protein
VKVVFDSDEPRIHYFLDAPQFFRKQAIMRIETRIHMRPQIPDPAVRNQDAEERRQAWHANRQHEADQLGIRVHQIHYRSPGRKIKIEIEITTIQYRLP